MPQIVLISGHAGSGKDTFADFLIKYLPDARKYAFADSIKEIARKYFDWNGIKDRKGRQLLIGIGAAGREENLHVWTERVIEKIEKDRPGIAVISDWRFKHEYEKMKEVFGMENIMTVRIQKEGIKVIDDISEHDLDDFLDFDFIIQNNGSLQELEKQAEVTAGYIQGILSKREIVELNSSIKIKMWLQDKTPHNEIGPAYVEYYLAGGVQRKIWLQKGQVHREDGPAVENYSRDGTIFKEEYFLNGKAVTKEALESYKKINSLLKEAQKEKKIRL
jgi:hypothetical protein